MRACARNLGGPGWLCAQRCKACRARQPGRTGEEGRHRAGAAPPRATGRAIMPQMAALVRTGIHTKHRELAGSKGGSSLRHDAGKALPRRRPEGKPCCPRGHLGGGLSRLALSPAGAPCRAGAGAVAAAAPAGCSSAPRDRSAPPASTRWPAPPAGGGSGHTTTQ